MRKQQSVNNREIALRLHMSTQMSKNMCKINMNIGEQTTVSIQVTKQTSNKVSKTSVKNT